MAHGSWIRMNREQSDRVIRQLETRADSIVFSRDVTEVCWRELPFYRNWRLYRLTNYATMPVFSMMYLSDGQEYFALDGMANSIYTVNEKDPLMLTEENIIPYLEFFFSNVHGSEGDVFLISDPQKMPFMSVLTDAQRQSIAQSFKPLTVRFDYEVNAYTVRGTMHYGGGLLAATIVVMPDGKISFREQNLLLTGIHFPESPYAHMWLEG